MHLKRIIVHPEKFPVADCYPYNLPFLNKPCEIEFPSAVTFFAGENGTGKTTLLKAIAKSAGIYIWESSGRPRYNYNWHEENLYQSIDLKWIDRPVPGHYFASRHFEYFTKLLDEWAVDDPGQLNYFGGKSLVAQSHGQSLMSFFSSRYAIKGIYFLDEPETALSPRTQIQLSQLLEELSLKGHAQFVIATHSPILLSLKNATIYNFDDHCLPQVHFKDTSNYKMFKKFFQE